MPSSLAKQKLFVEASAIAEPRPSGIGHSIVATIRALCQQTEFTSKYRIILLVPRDMRANLARWEFPADVVEVRSIWLEKHILQVLLKRSLLPPMDLLIGRGTYLFPNYKNWPLRASRSITYVYDVAYAIFPETIQPKNLAMLQRNLPRWIARTDFVVTISESSRQEIIKYLDCPADKVGVVYCGVDSNVYHSYPAEAINKVTAKYKIPGDYVLFVGNIEPRKNIDRLLDAYQALPPELLQRYALVLVGAEGWSNAATMQKIAKLQAAKLTIIHPQDYVPDEDMPVLYSGASLLVHPAIHEGFGFPPLQAMATGTPLAVSRIGAVEEVVGSEGNYFEPTNVDSIKETIERLLTNRETDQKLAAAQRRSQRFSWDASAKQLAQDIGRLQ